MSMKISEAYRTLGLEAGATPQEIKKAYSRLVHQFSPEKEPERFRKVREAYETVKDAPEQEEETLTDQLQELCRVPQIETLLQRAHKHIELGNYTAAASNLEKVSKLAPGSALIYKRLAYVQIQACNYQKAAANAEKATLLDPEDGTAYMLLANALRNRGWNNKARPAYRKAYELGIREKNFMLNYAQFLEEEGDPGKATELEQELFEDQRCADINEFMGYQSLYSAFLEHRNLFAEDVDEILDRYDDWVKANRQGFDGWEILYPLHVFIKKRQGLFRDRRIVTRVERSAKDAFKIGAVEENLLFNFRCELQEEAAARDDRLQSMGWARLAYLLRFDPNEDGGYTEYQVYDQILSMMKGEAEALRKDLPVIKNSYPILYDTYGKVLSEVIQYPAEAYRYLKEHYDQLHRKFGQTNSGGFYTLFPEEQRSGKSGTADADDEDFFPDSPEDPYVRDKEKVGRNDLCPCGSGKKFKKCCMGKGIYD